MDGEVVDQFTTTEGGTWPEKYREERRLEVIKLRRWGVFWEDIPDRIRQKFGASPHVKVLIKDFKEDVQRRVKETQESIQEQRAMMIERLDVAAGAIAQAVEAGNFDAIDTLIKLEMRRAKLIGADAPSQAEVTTRRELPQLSEAQILARIKELAAKVKGQLQAPVIDVSPSSGEAEEVSCDQPSLLDLL